jgi:hypothetical protein
MKMKKLWVLVALLAVVCGIWAVLFRTNLMPDQKATVNEFIKDLLGVKPKGLVGGILSGEDGFTALIDTQVVSEGDTIDGIKVIKIHRDRVEFEKDGKWWTQGLNETPGPEWQ